jgi:hypothetical protein
MLYSLLKIISVVIPVLAFISCTPGSCFEETTSFMKASFYETGTGRSNPPDSITMHGIGKEADTLYNKAPKVQPALFPFDAGDNTCGFMIRINGISDTMIVWYTSYPHLTSKECGLTYFHTLDSVFTTKNLVDTVIITNRKISTVNEENIRIFY